jgi:glycosyltransferase involved in cell wall biosynthesis
VSWVDLSLIVPLYKDRPHFVRNVLRLVDLLKGTRFQFEIILVDDASPDGLAQDFTNLKGTLDAKDVSSQLVSHPVNCGRGAAVKTGLNLATGTAAAFIDIDLENLPDALLPMTQMILNGQSDLIVGERIWLKGHLFPLRALLSSGYRRLVKVLLNLSIPDTETGLKVFHRARTQIALSKVIDNGWFWDTEMVHRCALEGLKVSSHPIVFLKDLNKESTVSPIKDSIHYLIRLYEHLKALALEKKALQASVKNAS